jgi:hypothetical protein
LTGIVSIGREGGGGGVIVRREDVTVKREENALVNS